MGLCLSKKDVLIQQPQLSLREQMLCELGHESHDHLMMLDSPSTSMLSVDSSSVLVSSSEKQLLKTGSAGSSSMLRSSSNVAECGSVAEWRTEQASPDGSSGSSSSRIHDLQSEARTSGFSYLSSPLIQGIDAYGIDNIAKSYAEARQKSKEKFELDGGVLGFGLGSKQHRKLLEIHKEEDEEEGEIEDEENIGDGCSKEDAVPELRTTKKTTTRSLHVFGEVFGDRTPETKRSLVGFPCKLKSSSCGVEPEIGVFGAERYFKRSDFDERLKLQKNRQHLGGFQKCDSLSESEADSELARSRQQHQGFCLDSGSEEIDEEDVSSTTSTQVESLKSSRKKAPSTSAAAFMAVPRSEMWPNFAHMNPSKGFASSSSSSGDHLAKRKEFLGIHHQQQQQQQGANAEFRASFSTDDISSTTYATDSGDEFFRGSNSNTNSRGFLGGFATAMPSSHHLRNPSAFGARSSSASSSLFEEDQKMHSFPKQQTKRFIVEEDDDGSDSDNSNDLFEIETLEAALGSLSSSSDKEFVYPKNKAFLRDPDISYSTSMSSMRNHHQMHHQLSHRGAAVAGNNIKPVLGPTLRTNVIVSSSKRKSEEQHQQQHQHRVESLRGLYYCSNESSPASDPKKQSLLGDLENKNSLLYRGLGIYGR